MQNCVTSATLIILTPMTIHDHHKRPLLYNFNSEFVERVIDYSISSQIAAPQSLIGTIPSENVIIPSTESIEVKTSMLDRVYSFMLIIDETASVIAKLPTRTIMYGIFDDEPLTNWYSSTPEKYLNPAANMIVTQRIVVNRDTQRNNNIVVSDTGVAHSLADMVPTDLFDLSPSAVVKSINDISDDTLVIEDSRSLMESGEMVLNTKNEIPSTQLKTILGDISTSVDVIRSAEMYEEIDDVFSPSIDNSLPSDIILGTLKNGGEIDRLTKHQIGSWVSNYFSINDLLTGIGMVEVVPIETAPNDVSIIPSNINNINNIFSSMVAATVPPIMRRVGLSALGFSYNSFSDATRVDHIESMFDDSDMVLKNKWSFFFARFKTDIHPILLANGGEYDLSIFSNMSGTTNVILNFLDFQPLPIDCVYQEPTHLGGIVSSTLGDENAVHNNVMEISNLISAFDDVIE